MQPYHLPHRHNYSIPGHAHELTFSCYRRYPFLKSDRTSGWLFEAIDAAREKLNFDVWAYVFMPEHAHIIIHPREALYDISEIRRLVKEPVARKAIDHLRRTSSHWLAQVSEVKGGRIRSYFWQRGGGYDRNILEPKTLHKMIEYIHLNPVRRGLTDQAAKWKWSSAAWIAGTGMSPLQLNRIPLEWASED